jgi:hypothetical protein
MGRTVGETAHRLESRISPDVLAEGGLLSYQETINTRSPDFHPAACPQACNQNALVSFVAPIQ